MNRLCLALPFAVLLACGGIVGPETPSSEGDTTPATSAAPSSSSSSSGTTTSVDTDDVDASPDCRIDGGGFDPGLCKCSQVCGPDGRWFCGSCPSLPDPFACGDETCDARSAYCKHGEGGPQPLDGGISESFECVTFDSVGCAGDHSCNCLEPKASPTLCSADGTHVTATYEYP